MSRLVMRTASPCRMIVSMVVALSTAFAAAEVVEEERWFNAEGQVVKTVKRTYTGRDADRSPEWEPAWVIRERSRGLASRRGSFSSARRIHGGYSYGFGYRYCYPRVYSGHYPHYSSRCFTPGGHRYGCLLYASDAADE